MKMILSALFVSVTFLNAQDFGYEYLMLTEFRSLGVSYNAQRFSKAPSNTSSDSNSIEFSTAVPFIEYRQQGGRFAVGYQEFTDRTGQRRESFSVYGDSHNDIPLGTSRGSKTSFVLPVVVAANYVRAQSPNSSVSSFDVGSLGIGTGLKYKYFTKTFGVQAFAVGTIYYASEGFSTDYGSQTSAAAEVQCIFSELLFDGILAGYRFEAQQWNMSDNALDYRRRYHGVFIGVLF